MILDWPIVSAIAAIAFMAGPLLTNASQLLCHSEASPSRRRQGVAGAVLGASTVAAAMVAPTTLVFILLVATGAVLLVVSMVDVQEQRIPDVITYPVMFLCGVAAVAGVLAGAGAEVLSAVIGAVVFTVILLVPHLMRPDAMGFGDVKLAVPLGFAVGWAHGDAVDVVVIIGWTVAAASVAGLALAALQHGVSRGALRSASVPFGPALGAAAWSVAALTLANS